MIVALFLLTTLVYANNLSGPFFFDDFGVILNNPVLEPPLKLKEIFFAEQFNPVASRPLVALSFALQKMMGPDNVAHYHTISVFFHALNACLVFFILNLYFKLTEKKNRQVISAMIATLWAVHPINTEAVNYMSQRTTLMMGFCFLGTVYCFLHSVSSPRPQRWFVAAGTICFLGAGCKEVIAVCPAVVLIVDRCLLQNTFKTIWQQRKWLYLSFLPSWLCLAFYFQVGPDALNDSPHDLIGPWAYLLTQSEIIYRYLFLCFWPEVLVSDYHGWEKAQGLSDAWPSFFTLLALLGWCIYQCRRKGQAAAGLLVFTLLAPTSSVFVLASELGAERRMYLPSIVVLSLSVLFISKFLSQAIKIHHASTLLFVLTALGLATRTHFRNEDYKSIQILWQQSHDFKNNIRSQFMAAQALYLENDRETGLKQMAQIIDDYPHLVEHVQNIKAGEPIRSDALGIIVSARLLGMAAYHSGNKDKALEYWLLQSQATKTGDPEPEALSCYYLGQLFLEKEEKLKALNFYQAANELFESIQGFRDIEINSLLQAGRLYGEAGFYRKSYENLEKVLELKPRHSQALLMKTQIEKLLTPQN